MKKRRLLSLLCVGITLSVTGCGGSSKLKGDVLGTYYVGNTS